MEAFFRELDYTDIDYKIIRQDSKLIIEHEHKIKAEDAIYNPFTENYIFAVKTYTGNYTYEVDYFLFSKDLELLEILRESEGVNPSFIISPNSEIWVSLSVTSEKIEKNGEIILPILERNRIEEPIVKRDTGMNYFVMKGRSYGYIVDNWGRGKEDRLVIYQFDKNSLFRDRKAVKLKGMYSCKPIIINGICYISDCGDNNCDTKIYAVGPKGNLMEAYATEGIENCPRPYILDITDKNVIMVTCRKNRMDCLSFSLTGILEERKTIFECGGTDEINTFDMYSVHDGTVISVFTKNSSVTILYKNKIFEKYESDRQYGLTVNAVSDECIYAHGGYLSDFNRIEIYKNKN